MVNHQKPMNAGMLTIHRRTGALARNPGATAVPRAIQPKARASQSTARSRSRAPRGSRPNTCWYSR